MQPLMCFLDFINYVCMIWMGRYQ